MPEETVSNLEPINESDLDLERKFGSGKKESGETNRTEEKPDFSFEKVSEAPEVKKEKERQYSKVLSKIKSQSSITTGGVVNDDAEVVSREQDMEGKVKKLVELAENKGVVHAVKVAKHIDDNYILDELHDRMISDELRAVLIQKGFIKEI